MVFPPPPGLSFLAYISGSITRTEYLHLVRMWEEKHANRNGDSISGNIHNRVDMGKEMI